MNKIKKLVLFLYLSVFAFGQLPGLLTNLLFYVPINIHIADILVIVYVVLNLTDLQIIEKFIKSYFLKIFFIVFFSLVVGQVVFSYISVTSLLYMFRLFAYLLFAFIIWVKRPLTKTELQSFFVSTAFLVCVLGLLQYFLLPDTRFLKILGWDDHYYRLISTFLDPTFTAIILVFSFIYTSFVWEGKRYRKIALLFILSVSLLLTYSRSGYLALAIGVSAYVIAKKTISKQFIIIAGILIGSIFALPRPQSEGVNLIRTFSIFSKIQNSQETLEIWRQSPVFGVGYNNICLAKDKLTSYRETRFLHSHSCSGADNSLFFMLSTIGVAGVIGVLWGSYKFIKSFKSILIIPVVVALLVHTQFTNTLFYPWVFVWVVLYCLEIKLRESK